jgi:serine/threonine protein kinase
MIGEALLANATETTLQPGQVIGGKYLVDYLLGEGGMATVWAGTNERTGKRVALKVIRRGLSATLEAESFLNSEALAASRVNHPNVVTVFDLVEHEGGACIVMELLDGESLASYIARNGALSVGEATGLLLPAMRGVAAAHAQGVIHRDLKPQNIFICVGPDGRVVTTKVLDFGISVMFERAMERSLGTYPGLVGTPAYMSPEHIEGAAMLDERVDVYGFGVLLYEALAGQQPFPGEPGTGLFRRILNEPAPPLAQFRPDLPAGLVRIVETAMAKEPDHRFANLDVMVSALEDEVMSTTPLPRLLTPFGGAPLVAASQSPSGLIASLVPAFVRTEPSGLHETKFLFGHAAKGVADPSPAGAEGSTDPVPRSQAMPSFFVAPNPTPMRGIRVAPPSQKFDIPSTGTTQRTRVLPGLRRMRGVVGAGFVLAIPFVVWLSTAGTSRVNHRAASMPAERAATAAKGSTVPRTVPSDVPVAAVPVAPVPIPAAVPPPTLATGALAVPGLGRAMEYDPAAGIPALASHSRRTMQESPKSSPAPRQAGREISSASKSGASAKAGAPRAGGLSADDF